MIRPPTKQRSPGFTLIELIIVIVISGVIGGMLVAFMRSPIDAYFSSNRRAELTDIADLAIRRMVRDIHRALPNSIRSNNTNTCIEFIPTKTGGRYRAETGGGNDILDFSLADGSFDMLGRNSDAPSDQQRIVVGDSIAIYNLGYAGANAYNDENTSVITDITENVTPDEDQITINPMKFPLASSRKRFHVIPNNEKIVSFVCNNGNLYRNSNYGYAAANSCPTSGGALLAEQVSTCSFRYDGSNPRNALVELTLGISKDTETVTLYMQALVNNIP